MIRIFTGTVGSGFQSTPPCGGRPVTTNDGAVVFDVSIHAPVRGATPILATQGRPKWFQSTPPCGGRHLSKSISWIQKGFNPRPRAGGDSCAGMSATCRCFNPRPRAGGDSVLLFIVLAVYVSIHAPVRGATGATRVTGCRSWKFQSTPPCGGRHIAGLVQQGYNRFQSTPPCGGRLTDREQAIDHLKFQSTPPCGGRPPEPKHVGGGWYVSIHAPVRGATHAGVELDQFVCVSIHAPVRGATLFVSDGEVFWSVSIHAPVRGATLLAIDISTLSTVSIHAPVRGATRLWV